MMQDLFKYLPSEITIDVLSRLPVRSIGCCKCVCKTWLHLLETNEFVKAHISKSRPGLLVYEYNEPSNLYKHFDLEDGPNRQSHELQDKPIKIFNLIFNLPKCRLMCGSSDGLLCCIDRSLKPCVMLNPITLQYKCFPLLYICNPITRECIKLPRQEFVCHPHWCVYYGFGKSNITGQYKVFSISQNDKNTSECQVYTLGTGSWRTISPVPTSRHRGYMAFLNGNLHCIAYDSNFIPWISCFNLETEVYSSFSTPNQSHGGKFFDVHALRDCLCLCEDTRDKIFIWLMKEYGVENSWTKEFVICKASLGGESHGFPYPLKVCKDGGLLLAWKFVDLSIIHYSNKDSSARKIDISEGGTLRDAIIFTPSLLSLMSFVREKVCSF